MQQEGSTNRQAATTTPCWGMGSRLQEGRTRTAPSLCHARACVSPLLQLHNHQVQHLVILLTTPRSFGTGLMRSRGTRWGVWWAARCTRASCSPRRPCTRWLGSLVEGRVRRGRLVEEEGGRRKGLG